MLENIKSELHFRLPTIIRPSSAFIHIQSDFNAFYGEHLIDGKLKISSRDSNVANKYILQSVLENHKKQSDFSYFKNQQFGQLIKWYEIKSHRKKFVFFMVGFYRLIRTL